MWNGRLAMDVDFGLAPDMFVFIPFDHFWAHDYLAFRAPLWRVPDLFRVSLLANHYGLVGGRFVVEGIGRERIGLLTHHEVRVEKMEFRDAHIAHSREIEHARVFDSHGGGIDHGRAVGHEGHQEGSKSGPGGSKDHQNSGH